MFIKKTKSLCPTCLKPLEAEVFEEDGKVWIKKECPDHGEFKNTYWSDAEIYNMSVMDVLPIVDYAESMSPLLF